MNNQVAILAGGLGTRLKNVIGEQPKPMAPIMGKPVLEHQIDLCKKHGFTRIALLVHYQSEVIQSYFGDGAAWGVELTYVVETIARGTAGALRDALDVLDDLFLVLYADTYLDIDLFRIWRDGMNSDAAGTLLLHPNDHPHDSDLVEVADDGFVVAMHSYPHPVGSCYQNLVNAALYVLRKCFLQELIPVQGKHDLAKDTFRAMLASGLKLKGYVTPEYIKDMGTPERLEKVEADLINGLPERLSARQRRVAVFLDRDGTLNEEVDHLTSAEKLVLLPKVSEAVHLLNRAGILAVGVTNQPVLARGDVSWDEMRRIHARLDQLLGQGHAYLDRMYLCPHHPDSGFDGEVPELKIKCDCRKPSTGMIDQAVLELEIDRRRSWLVGDSTADILAGQRAGLRTILLRTGYAGRDYKYPVYADYVCDDLLAAIKWVIRGHASAVRKLIPVAIDAHDARMILVGGASRSGKSMVAQVLNELMSEMGRIVHIIPLDAWLKSATQREEGCGVISRYDFDRILKMLKRFLVSRHREKIEIPIWDRKKSIQFASRIQSIGPDDILIVEGVPALMHPELREMTSLRVSVETTAEIRHQRMIWEYTWRGEAESAIWKRIKSREVDEVAPVQAASKYAKYIINTSEKNI